MTERPLIVEFEVGVPPAKAFDVWTRRCGMWWPPEHTVSGDPAAITFESRAGGRIVERTRDGAEHDWGHVLDWAPPTRLRYSWHLFFEPSQATEVELIFTAVAADLRFVSVVRIASMNASACSGVSPSSAAAAKSDPVFIATIRR